MWAIAFGSPEAFFYRGTHLMFAMVLVFLLYRFRQKTEDAAMIAAAQSDAELPTPKSRTPTAVDYALLLLGMLPILHIFFNYEYITNRIFYVDDLTTPDMVMGTLLVLIVLEATRRVIGWARTRSWR